MLRASLLSCLLAAVAAAAEPVAVGQGTLPLRWLEGVPNWQAGVFNNAVNFVGRMSPRGTRTFHTVTLFNRYLRLEIAPEAGGPVARAVYLPSRTDMFYLADSCNNGVVGWTSGAKISFPYKEHGIRLPDQPASWRVVRRPDGSATVAMWMEFSRFDGPWNDKMFGRYGNMLLSQHVTLRPEEAAFRVTYRVVNPAPYRQGRQLWNVATWPRYHTAAGVAQGRGPAPGPSTAQWIFPAAHVSGHGGGRFRPYDTGDKPLAELGGASVFGWAMRYGFAGLWYPDVKVNRLRITDPDRAPGGKQFYNSEGRHACGVELWTGTDSIFEQVEHWIGPGEAFQYALTYAMTEGIGKADYANQDVAVNVELWADAPAVEAVTYRATKALSLTLNGKPVGKPVACAPDGPARFAIPKAIKTPRVALVADGKTVLDESFPLKVQADEKRYETIRRTLEGAATSEKLGDSETLGRSYRRASYPAGTTDRGRVQLRMGALDAGIETLRQAAAADANDGEAWHLLGAALLERGQDANAQAAFRAAVRAQRPCPAARYFLALGAITAGRADRAVQELERLAVECPWRHWEGELLRAWLLGPGAPGDGADGPRLARRLADEDPADPRAVYVLWKACQRAGEKGDTAAARAALDAMLAEPGAQRRVDEFISATQGRWRHPHRMKSWDQWRREHTPPAAGPTAPPGRKAAD